MKSGFTLLEILISGALLSTLLVSTWFSFSSVRSTLSTSRQSFESHRRAWATMRTIELLILEACPYRQPVEDSFFVGDTERLSFVSLRNQDGPGPPVHVSIERLDTGEIALIHRPFKWLVEEADEPSTTIILPKVEDISFSFLDRRTDEWVDEWESTRRARQLPKLIEVNLVLENDRMITTRIPTRLDRDPSIP